VPEDSGGLAWNAAHLRNGVRVSVVSIAWTVVTSGITVTLGIARASLVLVAFGATGCFDAIGSMALVVHFRHALRHETFSARHERVALRVVTVGLIVVGGATLAESTHRLITGAHAHRAVVGSVVAAASLVVLAALAGTKRRTGRAIPSPALVADGALSFVGALLAAVTVAGTLLARRWPWIDAVAAGVVALGALATAVVVASE